VQSYPYDNITDILVYSINPASAAATRAKTQTLRRHSKRAAPVVTGPAANRFGPAGTLSESRHMAGGAADGRRITGSKGMQPFSPPLRRHVLCRGRRLQDADPPSLSRRNIRPSPAFSGFGAHVQAFGLSRRLATAMLW
jgi:hypothetical protein